MASCEPQSWPFDRLARRPCSMRSSLAPKAGISAASEKLKCFCPGDFSKLFVSSILLYDTQSCFRDSVRAYNPQAL